MKAIFPVLLSCGTETYCDNIWISVGMMCPVHHMWDVIDAIETREWHVTCHSCRYGRWAGMSHQTARILERRHLVSKPGHNTTIDFQVPEDVREKWRQVFGRKRHPARFIGIKYTNIEIGKDQPHRQKPFARIIQDNDDSGESPPF